MLGNLDYYIEVTITDNLRIGEIHLLKPGNLNKGRASGF